jgi:uncharacterized protein YdiU (UPF0061 family)
MLREYVIGEAMHALGIPTTRALAVVATASGCGARACCPGAVLARVAASHLRVGTLPVRRARTATGDCCARSPTTRSPATTRAARGRDPYLALFEPSSRTPGRWSRRWMLVGLRARRDEHRQHDDLGETIDYGPCAFMDAYDPATVFSSIDHGGRYAYGNQPRSRSGTSPAR